MKDSRYFQIIYYLLDKGKCTAPELAEKLGVSTRTIYRDLDVISAAGIPVYATQGKGGGISILPEYVIDSALLSDEEKEKIIMALQGIAAANETADDLLSKLRALFQTKAANWIEVDFSDWIKNDPNQDILSLQKEIHDFAVYPLEGIWTRANGDCLKKEKLEYSIMIRQPDFIGEEVVNEALCLVKIKKPNPLFEEIRFGQMKNGLCVEILHIGSFDDEPASFEKMDRFSEAHGLRRSGNYHREIYLSNASRVEKSKLKTIFRYQVERHPVDRG